MHKNTKKFVLKVFTLSVILIIIFNIGDNFLNANSKNIYKTNKLENKQNFKKVNNSGLGNIGVAITTNIGTSFKKIEELPVTIYQEIFSLPELLDNEKAQNEIMGKNMVIINEYLNVLKTDIKQLINSSYDKNAILNAYIDQLEYRFITGVKNQETLIKQRDVLAEKMNSAESQIEILKEKISNDFKNSDSNASLENINKYLELKNEYNLAKAYIVYINHFLAQYNFLNNYAKKQANILITNKEAIVKDAYLVIPDDGGIEALSDFNLIFTEDQIKK